MEAFMYLKTSRISRPVALLLMMSFLAFTGCPTGGGTDPATTPANPANPANPNYPNIPQYPAATPEEAAEDLADSFGTNATATGDTVTITGPVTIPDGNTAIASDVTVEVAAGQTLTIPAAATVSVASGATLTVEGTVTQAGTLNNSGEIEIPSGGVYELTNTGVSGTNTGTVTVKAGGAIKAGGSHTVDGSGLNIVEVGGEAYYNNNLLIGHSTSTSPIVELADGSFSWNNEQYNLNGNAALKSNFQFAPTSATLTLTIASGKTLTITALLVGSMAGQKIDNTKGGTITVSGGGTNNFYVNGTSSPETPGTSVYTWTANAGGSGNYGWERAQ
jgi:hypothetical protein